MPNPDRPSCCSLRYLRTPMGAVKVVNIVIGAISLILVGVSYVPAWTLGVFIGTVASCLLLSLLYITFYLIASSAAIQSKGNRVTSFLYHVLAGAALVVAGIELIGWSEYVDPTCKHNCPRLYTVGIAKTLTFMNGVLYLIVGFLGVKDDDLLDPDSADEDVPLLSSTTVLASLPGGGSIRNGGNSKPCYFDPYFHHNRSPYDDVRSNYTYRIQRPYNPYGNHQADHSCSQSYVSTGTYGAVRLIPVIPGELNREKKPGSVNGSVKNMPSSLPSEYDMADHHFIKE